MDIFMVTLHMKYQIHIEFPKCLVNLKVIWMTMSNFNSLMGLVSGLLWTL
jgi:hypothetical protein